MKVFRLTVILFLLAASCSHDDQHPDDTPLTTPDWTEHTHSKEADPDYEKIFQQDVVHTLEIRMTKSDWRSIQDNMKELFGFSFGQGTLGNGFPKEDPDYVAVSLKYNGLEWYKVGFRLKGNSTLAGSWRKGVYKLPFRLNFDKFEDEYPQIKNQRFYGFKELSFSPGGKDNSLIRDKVTSDIFRMAGVPAAQSAFYKVYIDFGSGLKYCGVYTMLEIVDDTMISDQFGEDEGNIYKPESSFTSFDVDQFEKKNNEDENDYSDVQSFITALHADNRVSNSSEWRSTLESTFNVDHFLRWLAVNTTIVNWDQYGVLPHNYYLYHHSVNKLTWIPWDNNEAMLNMANLPHPIPALSLSNVSEAWPLIRYVADDPVYYTRYKDYVNTFAQDVFTSEKMNLLFDSYHNLISPYVIGPQEKEQGNYTHLSSTGAFVTELAKLKEHVAQRQQAVTEFIE